MPTLTPTAATGATAKVGPMVYVDPARMHPADAFAELLADTPLNGLFVADLLSSMLSHERAGAHLYRSVQGRTRNPVLERQYEHFGEETREHVGILEGLIAQLGGDAQYVSPAARATEKAATALVESTFLLGGSLDLVDRELVMLEAVFLAEAKDQANWECFAQLAAALPESDTRAAFEAAAEQVASQEDEHFLWAREARSRLISARAQSSLVVDATSPIEEQIALVESLLEQP